LLQKHWPELFTAICKSCETVWLGEPPCGRFVEILGALGVKWHLYRYCWQCSRNTVLLFMMWMMVALS
jgi:hypothetical protein